MNDNPDAFPPLAERCRPKTLEEYAGQRQLLGEGKVLHSMFRKNTPFSMILWGAPGTGKTTLARIIAGRFGMEAHFLSAVSSGVAEVRKVIQAGEANRARGVKTLLFLDEIHRFNKAQQDSILNAVESGDIVLIGATTENPSFQVISPLLSRSRVLRLEPLSEQDLESVLDRALSTDVVLREQALSFTGDSRGMLLSLSQGDARRMLNVLETAVMLSADGVITPELLGEALDRSLVYYDRAGDRHYDTISAFIKSMRGSDPDAAVYYLARMILAGEDPVFIARRMVIFASEDIGNASPQALPFAVAALTAVQNIGMPEAEIVLGQCATFLASCPKSNASYVALMRAKGDASGFAHEIPMHLRNAPTKLMKGMGYAKGYRYPHDFKGHFVDERYLPDAVAGARYYEPSEEGMEKGVRDRLRRLWPGRFGPEEK